MTTTTRETTRHTTRRRAVATGAAAALTALGIVATAGAASAWTPPDNEPYTHTISIETRNVTVTQNNWVRADASATQGYSIRTLTHGSPNYSGETVFSTPTAENTLGRITVHSHAGLEWTAQPYHQAYDGSAAVDVEVDMSVNKGWSYPQQDRETQSVVLENHQTSGWKHIEVVGAGGDFVAFDYRITNHASPAE